MPRSSSPQSLLAGGAVLIVGFCLAGGPEPAADRGERIYLMGESVAGREVTALLGREAMEIPASVLPCGNCHGDDGRGHPESGVSPSSLNWESLTRAPHEHSDGRKHPAFSEQTMKRAITAGVDPAGNPLAVAMPRYRMSEEDLEDLIAYLKRLAPESASADDEPPGDPGL